MPLQGKEQSLGDFLGACTTERTIAGALSKLPSCSQLESRVNEVSVDKHVCCWYLQASSPVAAPYEPAASARGKVNTPTIKAYKNPEFLNSSQARLLRIMCEYEVR